MSIKVSVIIPVYKVEKYLKQCVDSVLNQSYQNLEIILVDDGSPDRCPDICDEYQDKDKRVIVIHKENMGLSEARNTGIKIATGEYIIFLDSDDFWDDLYGLERLISRLEAKKVDVLNFSYKKFYESSLEKKIQFEKIKSMDLRLNSKVEQLEYLTQMSLYIACAWNKLIRTEIIKEGIFFQKDMLSEDIEWCARLLIKAKSFDFVNDPICCYRQREGSITHTFVRKSCIDLKDSIIECVQKAEKSDVSIYLYRYAAYQLATFIIVQALTEECPQFCIEELKKYTWLLKYHGKNKKLWCVNLACRILKFENICKILKKIKN